MAVVNGHKKNMSCEFVLNLTGQCGLNCLRLTKLYLKSTLSHQVFNSPFTTQFSGTSIPWAKRGGGEASFCLPCQLFFLLWFSFIFTKIRGGGDPGTPLPLLLICHCYFSKKYCTAEWKCYLTRIVGDLGYVIITPLQCLLTPLTYTNTFLATSHACKDLQDLENFKHITCETFK